MAKIAKQKAATKTKTAKAVVDSVDSFIEKSTHPLKDLVTALRKVILAADKQLTEHVKWNAPSFCYDGDDRITMNLSKQNVVLIIFHRGATSKSSKGRGKLIDDESGLLEWPADDRAVVKINSVEDLKGKKTALTNIIKHWIVAAG